MKTIESGPSRGRSRFAGIREHIRLVMRIGGMLIHYFTTGRRVRQAYRRCEATGETYWVDEGLGE